MKVKQIRAPKTSSVTRALLKRAERVSSVQEYWELIQGTENKAAVEEFLNLHIFESRKALLLELANLHDRGFGRFSKRWGVRFLGSPGALTERDVFKLRDGLRKVWRQDAPIAEKQRVLEEWLVVPHPIPTNPRRPFSYIGQTPLRVDMWKPLLNAGRIEPAFHSLRAQLIQAVLEHHKRLAICRNPDCPAPYFTAKRSDQKYCERGECTAYAQRSYALGWWNREGNTRRKKRSCRAPHRVTAHSRQPD